MNVCKNAWVFGKLPTKELQTMYKNTFKQQKIYKYPHTIKQSKTLKYAKAPKKLTKAMLIKASGALIFP